MIVNWSDRAREELFNVASFIKDSFGRKYMNQFMRDVVRVNSLLADNPWIGKEEDSPPLRRGGYRGFVVRKKNKIIYHVVDGCIEVAAFWDTRREPAALKEELNLE